MELGADKPLQSYLVESIYDCLWWIRRYEEQKRIALVNDMTGWPFAYRLQSFTKSLLDAGAGIQLFLITAIPPTD